MERKCNINTVSPAHSLRGSGRGGIPGVVERPLKLSSFAHKNVSFLSSQPVVAGAGSAKSVIILCSIGDRLLFLDSNGCSTFTRSCQNCRRKWSVCSAQPKWGFAKRHATLRSCKPNPNTDSRVCFYLDMCGVYRKPVRNPANRDLPISVGTAASGKGPPWV